MEMIKFGGRNQIILILGLLVLVGATSLSIFGVSRLEEAFEKRSSVVVAQDAYDNLSKKVKDWQIQSATEIREGDEQALSRAKTVKGKLASAIQSVEMVVEGKHPQADIYKSIRRELVLLSESTGPPNLDDIGRIEKAIEELNNAETADLAQRSSKLISSINQQMGISVVSLLLAVVLIAFSVNVRRRHELVRLETIRKLESLKEKAESASLLKSKFLSTVSHEIRTPLNGIIGLSDILANSPPTLNQQTFARMIHQSGKTLLRIINDILDFSKIEAGKFELTVVDCSLADIADQVLFTLSPKAAEKSINLNYEIDPLLPKLVKGDPDRISQILFNLVGNAIKFTSVGGVILRIKKDSSSPNEVKVLFTIDDTGVGISKSDMANLFTPFVQAHQGGTSGEPGTGLGLSISQSIVRAMGGDIEVQSEVGRGSQFLFFLPFRDFSQDRIETRPHFRISKEMESQVKIEPIEIQGHKPRVLIVEDNPTNQVVAQAMLERLQIDYLTVANGAEALDTIENSKLDLVLMDCQMPILDGFAATQEIRRRGIKIPIVAMTANAYGEDEQKCKDIGMDGFLTKPLSIEALREELLQRLPKSNGFLLEPLSKLDASVGIEARKKVVRAFLSTTQTFRDTLQRELANKDLDALKRLGHRFKSSALCVGGSEFGVMCESIEKSESCEVVASLSSSALEALTKLEGSLQGFS